MGSASLLLQMLEPMVRPPGTASPRTEAKLPMEQQSFEQMLAQIPAAGEGAGAIPDNGTEVQPVEAVASTNSEQALMAQLGSVDRIENAALRTILNEIAPK